MAPQLEIITSTLRFQEIARQWDVLWHRCGAPVFQCHGWIATWLESTSESTAPRVAVAWQGSELVAAIPLAIRRRFGIRTLQWSAQVLNDYCDALATPDAASELSRLWDAVWQQGGFDIANLAQVRPDAIARRFLERDMGTSVTLRRRDRQQRCVAIDCNPPNSEAWFRDLGKKGRNNFWRGERVLAELGGKVTFQCMDPAKQSIEPELQRTFALKEEWVRLRKQPSPLLGDDGKALYPMLQAAAKSGTLRLFVLLCGDRLAAASVNFVQGELMLAYMTSYDPIFERASPGMLLLVHYVRWAFDNRIIKVDLLRGDEPFKLRLATSEINLNTYMGARSLIVRGVLSAREWWARARRSMGHRRAEMDAPQQAHRIPALSGE